MTVMAILRVSGGGDANQNCRSSSGSEQAFGHILHLRSPSRAQSFLADEDELTDSG
jgi:hypothetical protein